MLEREPAAITTTLSAQDCRQRCDEITLQGGARFFSDFSRKRVLGRIEGGTLRWSKNSPFRGSMQQVEMTGEITPAGTGALISCTFAPRPFFLPGLILVTVLGMLFGIWVTLLGPMSKTGPFLHQLIPIGGMFVGLLILVSLNIGIYLLFANSDREFLLDLLRRTVDGHQVDKHAHKLAATISRSSKS